MTIITLGKNSSVTKTNHGIIRHKCNVDVIGEFVKGKRSTKFHVDAFRFNDNGNFW